MRFLLLLVFCCSLFGARAQEQLAFIHGQVMEGGEPREGVFVKILERYEVTATDAKGSFRVGEIPFGTYKLVIEKNMAADTFSINVNEGLVDLGTFMLPQTRTTVGELAFDDLIAASFSDRQSDEFALSVIDKDAKSAFPISFALSSLGYRPRGHAMNELGLSINGIVSNDLRTGWPPPIFWSGLRLLPYATSNYGLDGEAMVDRLLGSSVLTLYGADQKKSLRVAYTNSNRSIRNGLFLSYHSGLLPNGWALSGSFSKRWSTMGYVPGTFHDEYAYQLGLSKRLNNKSILHFSTLGAPVKAGRTSAATKEAFELTDTRYNPNWGYQGSEMRNAKVSCSFEPFYLLNYQYYPNRKNQFELAAAYQSGYDALSSLDWYHADDPRPDYYKNLPSYYLFDTAENAQDLAASAREEWMRDVNRSQLDWQRLYETNQLNFETFRGFSGRRSLYVLGEDRKEKAKYSFMLNYNRQFGKRFASDLGIDINIQDEKHFRRMLDLLGGDYYVDLNQYVERTYVGNTLLNQNDLNHPDRIVREGDTYQYNYRSQIFRGLLRTKVQYRSANFDWFLQMNLRLDRYRRQGYFRNGMFADDSYGKSEAPIFMPLEAKTGFQQNFGRAGMAFANASLVSRSPYFDDVFISPKIRNTTIRDPRLASVAAFEAGYGSQDKPWGNVKITVFGTQFNNATKILRFYDDSERSFVNYLMRKIDQRHLGFESFSEIHIVPSLTVAATINWLQAFYTSRPEIQVYRDNDTSSIPIGKTVFWKGYYASASPQTAAALAFQLRPAKTWLATVSWAYLDRSYIAMNPNRLTPEAIDGVEPKSSAQKMVVEQEKLPHCLTVDLFVLKSFLIKLPARLQSQQFARFQVRGGLSNITNNQNLLHGFQQMRYDNKASPEKFANKYLYGYGRTYSLAINMVL